MKTLRTAIEAAVEFKERFPDEYDRTVLDHVEYVMDTRYENPNSVVALAIIYAYDHGMDSAKVYCKSAFGIEI